VRGMAIDKNLSFRVVARVLDNIVQLAMV